MNLKSFLVLALAAAVAQAGLAQTGPAQGPPAFWISVIDDGVYRVTHEDLALDNEVELESSGLALTYRGEEVPIWIADGGDGTFDPGDSFDFVGHHLEGDTSFYSEHSRHNAYRLALTAPTARRVVPGPQAQSAADTSQPAPLVRRTHFEKDEIMVRFSQGPAEPDTETWFWKRMSFLDQEPFALPVDTSGLTEGECALRVQMRGWSSHRLAAESDQPQHRAVVEINETPVAAGDWDGQDFLTIAGGVPSEALAGEEQTVTVTVPTRRIEGEADPMIDLSLLNWVEFDYPHSGVLTRGQTRLTVGGSGLRSASLQAPSTASLVVYDDRGRRWSAQAAGSSDLTIEASFDQGEAAVFAVRDGAYLRPAGVAIDRPSAWRTADHRIDYLMIAHSSLLEGTERLAAFHRSQGLEVAVIDVQDVYDEFNHGIVHPRAIRDLLAHAYDTWIEPRPLFVLLVGDSSWDIDRHADDDRDYADWSYQAREGTRAGFLKNDSTPYTTGPDNRALIPTGSFKGAQGHAASDNFFVALEDGDHKPLMAIGRFPVVDPAELDAIVDKTIRYVEESGVGPWRRRLLWISNEALYIQRLTNILADEQIDRGFNAGKVYPLKSEKSNEKHQEKLLEAFAEGQLVVHFHGHGGRYIWRTGPTDYQKNRDLFNLDHLDLLEPSARLPVILSMTCFSAPFDHPLADSIGEKFLRLPDRGAIAVFAASWRNSPATALSRGLVEELTKPQSIGEAILKAKQSVTRRDLIETYNLLGDPAVMVAAPQAVLEIDVVAGEGGELLLQAQLPGAVDGFDGRAIVEWIDTEGAVVATDELAVDGTSLATSRTAPPNATSVSVYMWDAERGLDGLGHYDWTPPQETEADAVATSASQ